MKKGKCVREEKGEEADLDSLHEHLPAAVQRARGLACVAELRMHVFSVPEAAGLCRRLMPCATCAQGVGFGEGQPSVLPISLQDLE